MKEHFARFSKCSSAGIRAVWVCLVPLPCAHCMCDVTGAGVCWLVAHLCGALLSRQCHMLYHDMSSCHVMSDSADAYSNTTVWMAMCERLLINPVDLCCLPAGVHACPTCAGGQVGVSAVQRVNFFGSVCYT
jgi:hypothetical protein